MRRDPSTTSPLTAIFSLVRTGPGAGWQWHGADLRPLRSFGAYWRLGRRPLHGQGASSLHPLHRRSGDRLNHRVLVFFQRLDGTRVTEHSSCHTECLRSLLHASRCVPKSIDRGERRHGAVKKVVTRAEGVWDVHSHRSLNRLAQTSSDGGTQSGDTRPEPAGALRSNRCPRVNTRIESSPGGESRSRIGGEKGRGGGAVGKASFVLYKLGRRRERGWVCAGWNGLRGCSSRGRTAHERESAANQSCEPATV